jgi:hypothetical protein
MAELKTDVVRLRISPDLKEKLRILAEADGRTMSNYLEKLIREAVKSEE